MPTSHKREGHVGLVVGSVKGFLVKDRVSLSVFSCFFFFSSSHLELMTGGQDPDFCVMKELHRSAIWILITRQQDNGIGDKAEPWSESWLSDT